jgi:hypothetical protein
MGQRENAMLRKGKEYKKTFNARRIKPKKFTHQEDD